MSDGTMVAHAPRRGRRAARVHGVLALDKPAGMTSFGAVREVRRLLDERRVGHAGTLDPAATGLLPICVGAATRLVDYFHQQPKRYRCVLRLGERSDTMDTEGTVTPGADASALDSAAVLEVLPQFVGDITQVPPMHSAVRHEGRHLYELARQGVEVERSPRPAHVESIALLDLRAGAVTEVEVEVVCGKGTYMRVLAADIGDLLGVGGLLGRLRRTGYGCLGEREALTLEALRTLPDPASALLPPAVAVDHLPRLDVPPQLALQILRGQAVWVTRRPQGAASGATVRVHDVRGELLALGELTGLHLKPTKVLAGGAG
ncbi:MAG TPA: tRNA pseudouridine(55) synthase TruB [Candidatus Dormibacteraeota bacterium]